MAAGIPVLLALTSVGATLGLLGPVSQLAPVDASVMHVVLLVGMAVGVDYSLHLKREREERAAGREKDAAIEAAAATSGRAVVISGLTVMVAWPACTWAGSRISPRSRPARSWSWPSPSPLPDRPARRALEARRPGRGAASRSSGASRTESAEPAWSRFLDRVLRRPLVSALVSGPAGGARGAGARHADLAGSAQGHLA